MIRVLAIDPGLDGIGLAVFDAKLWKGAQVIQSGIACLVETGKATTRPTEPLEERLGFLASAVEGVIALHRVEGVAIELPARAGPYQERLNRQRGRTGLNAASLQTFDYAVGAIIAGAMRSGVQVELMPASHVPKAKRHEILAVTLEQLHLDRPSNKDLLDAIWIGADAICRGRFHVLRPVRVRRDRE